VLKLRIALCLALIVGTLTLLNGTLQGARLETVIYRFIISIAIFGFIGYGLGIIVERFLQHTVAKNLEQEQEKDSLKDDKPSEDSPGDSEFAPFTADSFQQVKRPEE
jgi:hypothetical protein